MGENCMNANGDARIAVVMITHNRRQEVLTSLGHLTRLPERPPIILVDNGSTDGTLAAVTERFPQVRTHAVDGNLGAAGRTVGLQLATTPYVALCDDDTWWEPGALSHAADLFDAHSRLAVATGRILVGPEQQEDPICRLLEDSPLPAEDGMPGRPLLGFLAGASVVRRAAVLAVGGFEPRFFIGGEEELLATDLAAAGWWLCYVPALTVHHYPAPRRDGETRRWHLVRNALWSAWLRRPFSGALCKTLRLVQAAPLQRETWEGVAAALAGLPWVHQNRRVVPPQIEKGVRLLERAQLH
jgi:GT2 family glycosyltransferase